MKTPIFIFIFFVVAAMLFSCGNIGYDKHESGLLYRLVEHDENARHIAVGDVVSLDMSYELENGRVMFRSAAGDRTYMRTAAAPEHSGGSFQDGLNMLCEGDSAVFKINAESFLLNTEHLKKLPKNVVFDDFIIVKLRVREILDRDDFEKILDAQYHGSEATEMEILTRYLSNANITVEPTASGLYYIEKEAGSGPQVAVGDIVSIDYTLTLVDGRVVETTLTRQPFEFCVGDGHVIPGLDEAIQRMHVGTQAMAIIPSRIGYGNKDVDGIPPYSTLIFDITLREIK